MPRPRHYIPEIRRFLVSALYHEAQHQGIPMTRLTNRLLESALTGTVGWQRATEATAPPPQQTVAISGK